MASPAPSISRHEASALVRQVQSTQLINRQLSSVCQVNGLKSTGVKAELQRRIVNLIQGAVNANDAAQFHQIRQSIANALAQRPSSSKGSASRNVPSHFAGPQAPTTNPMAPHVDPSAGAVGDGRANQTNGHRSGQHWTGAPPKLIFKPSPFYEIIESVCEVRTCEVMQQHRHSIHIPIRLNEHPWLQKCVEDDSFRVMVFCGSESSGVQNIAFPHQSELRVNGDEIKANLRGLKNKPGSTRPVDITHALRLKPNYQNNVEFIYALTSKKFYIVANLCKVSPIDTLVSEIRGRYTIPKDHTIEEISRKSQDPDVVATSLVLSLKCPLSCVRLKLPCRSLRCDAHIQCFDAESYLLLQQQGPQWLCPICNKPAFFGELVVDEYVRDILAKAPKSLDSVIIEPNGRWLMKPSDEEETSTTMNGAAMGDEGDDGDAAISDISVVNGRRFETPRTRMSSVSTPIPGSNGSPSSAPRGASSQSAKRPAPAIVDLTLSDEDDEGNDEPIQRPNKRQNTGANGLPGPLQRNFLSESPLGSVP